MLISHAVQVEMLLASVTLEAADHNLVATGGRAHLDARSGVVFILEFRSLQIKEPVSNDVQTILMCTDLCIPRA